MAQFERPPASDQTTADATGQPSRRRLRRAAVVSSLLCGGWVALLVGWSWLDGGRSWAERTATSLVMPIGALWLAALAATIFCWHLGRRAAAIIAGSAFLFISVTCNGLVAGAWIRNLEHPYPGDPLKGQSRPLDAVVLLGGYASENRFDVPEVNGDGQRLVLAAQLWHGGKTKTLICTGQAGPGRSDPAEISRQLLQSLGVPADALFLVGGPNTHGEMQSLRSFFTRPPRRWRRQTGRLAADEAARQESSAGTAASIGLLTTAYHLPRAMRLADDAGLQFQPLPCGFSGGPQASWTVRDLIPSAGGGKKFSVAWRETLAWLVGR